MLTAAAHEGSGTCGRVKSTCPGTPRWPKRISITILMSDDEEADAEKERDGARPRRAARGGRTRPRTPPLRSTPGGTGCSSAWRRSPSRPPTATTPPGAGSGAGGRRPVSFLGRPTPPSDRGRTHPGRRRPRATSTTGRRLLEEPPPELPCAGALATAERCARRTIRGSRSGRSRPTPGGRRGRRRSPAAAVVVVAGASPDFDFVLAAVLVAAPGVAARARLGGRRRHGRRSRRGGRRRRGRRRRPVPGRRHLGRRIADLCVGRRRRPAAESFGVSGSSSLEPPPFHVVSRAGHRLLCRTVVGVDPRCRWIRASTTSSRSHPIPTLWPQFCTPLAG